MIMIMISVMIIIMILVTIMVLISVTLWFRKIIVQVNVLSKMFSSSRVVQFRLKYGDEMTYLVEDLVEGIWLGSIKCDIVQ
jgi:hypothetical protein